MAAVTMDGQLKLAGAGPEWPGLDHHAAQRQAAPQVQSEGSAGRRIVHDAIHDHGQRAAETLLGRLKDQLDSAVQLVAVLGQ